MSDHVNLSNVVDAGRTTGYGQPVDFAEVMADISAVMTRIRTELGATHDIEGQLMSLLHQQLGSAHSTAFLLLAYRRETRVTPEVVARRLVVTEALTMDVTG